MMMKPLSRALLALAAFLPGCDPYATWPDPGTFFPYLYEEEAELPPYALVRVETETWRPLVDLEETVLYVEKSVYHKPSAPIEELLHFGEMRPSLPPLAEGDTLLSFVGDVMRFDGGWSTFADPVADRLVGLRVGNLETPTSDAHPVDRDELADEYGIYAFNSPVELAFALPLDVVQLNNNHSLDLGDLGLERTVEAVSASGRTPLGVDDNLVMVSQGEIVVALLSYTWGLNVTEPSTHDLSVVPFGHLEEPIDLDLVARQISSARAAGATHVALLLHWGYEYEYYPDPHFLVLGRSLVSLGADLIVGSGPHCVQPAEICDVNHPLAIPGTGRCSVRTADGQPRTAAILYSLGDFGTEFESVPLSVGIIATVSLRVGAGVTGLRWDPVASVSSSDGGTEILPLDALSSEPPYIEESDRLDVLLGARWRYKR